MVPYPILHVLGYGESGSGKSTFAATFPKPMIVFCFDAYGKDVVYRKRGRTTPEYVDELGVVHQDVVNDAGELLIAIEYFHDEDPEQPGAYERFLKRMNRFDANERAHYRTAVLDSVTSMELCARKMYQHKILKLSKEPRQWYAGATERLEEMLCSRFGSFRDLNVLVLAHIDQDKDELYGTFVRTPSAPGRLRSRLAAFYPEMYRANVTRDGKNLRYSLQTRSDMMYVAFSMEAEAPDPCEPRYSALWANFAANETQATEPTVGEENPA